MPKLAAGLADRSGMATVLILVALLGVWVAWAYNRLVRHANLAREAWSGIDVQLKRRHDLIPNLVTIVESYAKHEHEVLEDVTRARSRASGDDAGPERLRHENQLSGSLKSLLVVAEDYPELLANRSFADLHGQLVEVEDHLQMARRYFNGAVRDYNISVESFPSNLVARALGFQVRRYFEIASAIERRAPVVEINP
jgi:LemA protein